MNLLKQQQGFSLIELMIATLLGLIISYAVLETYLAQSRFYTTSNSQSLILNTENALIYLITPTVRSAGFLGCGTVTTAVSNLNGSVPDPLGSINMNPTFLKGYNGSGTSFTLTQTNPGNDSDASHWTPALPGSLAGQVQQGNDVLLVLGATPGAYPIGVTQIDPGSSAVTLQNTANTTITPGQLGSISDCVKSVIFQITGVGASSVMHASGTGSMQNSSSNFPVNFSSGSQFMPVQQTAFFVGQGQGGESALMRGILTNNTWAVEPLVPGIELMKVQYGVGANQLITQYVSADAVTDWTKVYAVRIGFLIAGKAGSASTTSNYTVLNTVVTVPADTLLRHTFEMTVQLRNSL